MLIDVKTGRIRLSRKDRQALAHWCEADPGTVRTVDGLHRFVEQQKWLYPGPSREEQLVRGLIDRAAQTLLAGAAACSMVRKHRIYRVAE